MNQAVQRQDLSKTSLEQRAVSNDTAISFDFARGDVSSFERAAEREWLVTNGIGGYAAGTVADANTRRYHGLLVAALQPPLGRTVLVAKLDADVSYGKRNFALSSNEFADGLVEPRGFQHIERFRIEDGQPIWEYALDDALLERRLFMPHGSNTTLVRYRLLRATQNMKLQLRPLCVHRDYHSHNHGGWDFRAQREGSGFRVDAFEGATPYFIRVSPSAEIHEENAWYWGFRHRMEAQRGLDDSEDLFAPGLVSAELAPGESVVVSLSTDSDPPLDFSSQLEKEQRRLAALTSAVPAIEKQPQLAQLVLAADQFIVARSADPASPGHTVIAGYPWFGDWGRDTMIALPGLALSTGRSEIARSVLLTFAQYLDQGMLPNRFPDGGEAPEYNTVDATLWYIHAVREYTRVTEDLELAHAVFDALLEVVDWHRRGTRYGIRVDAQDGLLAAGEEGVQLTWMDAKVGDWVVTPRIGKAVEINALWYNALRCIEDLAHLLGRKDVAAEYHESALRVEQSFTRFWNEEQNCLYDVLDGSAGDFDESGRRRDHSIRPNQILAVSLPHSALSTQQQRAVVDSCGRHLVTSYGLRSLAPFAHDYTPYYCGGPVERDGAYHQGTVWAWLLPPFAEAHYRVYGDSDTAASYLRPLFGHLREACVGTVSEIFDGDAPHRARGCFAQAWSVAELLRVWLQLHADA